MSLLAGQTWPKNGPTRTSSHDPPLPNFPQAVSLAFGVPRDITVVSTVPISAIGELPVRQKTTVTREARSKHYRLAAKDVRNREARLDTEYPLKGILEDNTNSNSYAHELQLTHALAYIREVKARKESADNALWMSIEHTAIIKERPRVAPTFDDVAQALRYLNGLRPRGPVVEQEVVEEVEDDVLMQCKDFFF